MNLATRATGQISVRSALCRHLLLALLAIVGPTAHATGVTEDNPSYGAEFEGHEYFVQPGLSFSFSAGIFEYHVDDSVSRGRGRFQPPILESDAGPYELHSVEGYTVARVSFPSGQSDLYVFSSGYHVVLFDTKRQRTLIGTKAIGGRSYLFPAFAVEASSELGLSVDGKAVRFSAANLSDPEIVTHWVEGVGGPGVGEVLRLQRFPVPFSSFLIINGVFSPSQPSLFYENNRVKRIYVRVYDELGRLRFEGPRELEDTPQLQLVDSLWPGHKIEIEILEVYPGTTYDDTAVTAIFFDAIKYLENEVAGWRF